MARRARGQSGIELAALFGFMIFIFLVFSLDSAQRTQAIQTQRQALEAEKVGDLAATNINIAFSVGDGYSSVFYLPQSLSTTSYEIAVDTQTQRLEITYGEDFYQVFPLLTANITGIPKPGMNAINNTKGEIRVG